MPSVTPLPVSVAASSVRPWESSSFTVTRTRGPLVTPGTPCTACVTCATSSTASSSWPAVAVTVCAVFQFVALNVSAPLSVTSGLLLAGVTVTAPAGWPVSTAV